MFTGQLPVPRTIVRTAPALRGRRATIVVSVFVFVFVFVFVCVFVFVFTFGAVPVSVSVSAVSPMHGRLRGNVAPLYIYTFNLIASHHNYHATQHQTTPHITSPRPLPSNGTGGGGYGVAPNVTSWGGSIYHATSTGTHANTTTANGAAAADAAGLYHLFVTEVGLLWLIITLNKR